MTLYFIETSIYFYDIIYIPQSLQDFLHDVEIFRVFHQLVIPLAHVLGVSWDHVFEHEALRPGQYLQLQLPGLYPGGSISLHTE